MADNARKYRVDPRGNAADVARGYMMQLQAAVAAAAGGDSNAVSAATVCALAAIPAWLEALYEQNARNALSRELDGLSPKAQQVYHDVKAGLNEGDDPF